MNADTNGANNSKKLIAALAVLVLVVVMVLGVKALSGKDEAASAAGTSTTATSTTGLRSSADSQRSVSDAAIPPSPTARDSETTAGAYKDGTYQATGSYRSPGGQQTIDVSVTVKDGKVAETSAQSGAKDGTSRQFQGEFISGYKGQVVGKALSEINLSKVSGSSLTPQGFNDALEQIKDQAKA